MHHIALALISSVLMIWTLQSTSSGRLVVPPIRLSIVVSRDFAVAVPRIWNGLLVMSFSARSPFTFRGLLKCYYFNNPTRTYKWIMCVRLTQLIGNVYSLQ